MTSKEESFLWLFWSWTTGDLFALETPVDCMKIVLMSTKPYWERKKCKKENSTQVTDKPGASCLKGLGHSSEFRKFFRERSSLKVEVKYTKVTETVTLKTAFISPVYLQTNCFCKLCIVTLYVLGWFFLHFLSIKSGITMSGKPHAIGSNNK